MPADCRTSRTAILMLVMELHGAVRSSLAALGAESNITPSQFIVMQAISEAPGQSASELARRFRVRAQTMAELTASLQSRDLMRHVQSSQDRRRHGLVLTAEGRSVFQELQTEAQRLEAQMLSVLDEDQIPVLKALLNQCLRSMSA